MRTAEDRETAEKDFIFMLEHCDRNRFDEYFKHISSKTNNFEDIFNAYLAIRDQITGNFIYCDLQDSDIKDFREFVKEYEDRLEKLDMFFLKYAKNITPPLFIKELIDNGLLKDEKINGKYVPCFDIKDFIYYLSKNDLREYLEFSYFDKYFIFNVDDKTIKQYLKPSMIEAIIDNKEKRYKSVT
jgi:hypothetical protein